MMQIRITDEIIAKGRSSVVKHWTVVGSLLYGPLFGITIVSITDLSRYPLWSKVLVILACTAVIGPAWGYFSGRLHWHFLSHKRSSAAASD